jgi:hypothetical protein
VHSLRICVGVRRAPSKVETGCAWVLFPLSVLTPSELLRQRGARTDARFVLEYSEEEMIAFERRIHCFRSDIYPSSVSRSGVSIPWTCIQKSVQRRKEQGTKERRFVEQMKKAGRLMEWQEFKQAEANGGGTAIGEYLSIKGLSAVVD